MTGLLLLLAASPDPERAGVDLAVTAAGQEVRVGLLVALPAGPLGDRQRELLGGWTPTGDGTDPLERLAPDGRLLRVVVAPPSPHSARLAVALRTALGADTTGRLTAAQVRAAEAVLLKRFDADGDGCLTALEIVPDLATAAPPPAEPVAVRVVPAGAESPSHTVRLALGSRTRSEATAGGVRLDGYSPAPGSLPPTPKDVPAADRVRYERVVREVVTLTVRPQERGLFEVFDQDGDGQLSRRELRTAADRLTAADLAPSRPTVALTLTAGRAAAAGPPLVPRTVPRTGPAWFRALDRNDDGDVDRSEWIGTAADFARYDADGDGLISAAEAEGKGGTP